MKKNMDIIDRLLRGVIALVIVILSITGVLTGTASTILLILAGVFILTSITGNCPLYVLFKVNTCRVKTKN
ncbi:DUF2892 domain-containing protein [Seonamhaeicola algicola]|uniref:DUF2892 domain-containing protein n=1 Tax=Seonamhaeicola algicola TaxID=1719036 RepID=A0A5C7AWP5_9FLAO|nr:DUF2892 domain-containing protein [Seonamhaeicola algicola]